MRPDPQQPYVDALSMSEEDVLVYEAVATLEYAGRPVTRERIAAITGLDQQTLGQALESLTERRALVRTDAPGEPEYAPATRDWSAVPDEPASG
jgi:hypothetical protein